MLRASAIRTTGSGVVFPPQHRPCAKTSKDPLIYTPSSWTHGSATTTGSTKLRIQSSRREKTRSMSPPARNMYISRPMLLNAVGGYRGLLNPDRFLCDVGWGDAPTRSPLPRFYLRRQPSVLALSGQC